MNLATWNVGTLLHRDQVGRPQRRTALAASELGKYNVEFAQATPGVDVDLKKDLRL